MKNKDYEAVIENTSRAIEFDPENKKAYLNRAEALEKTEKEEDALEGKIGIVYFFRIFLWKLK